MKVAKLSLYLITIYFSLTHLVNYSIAEGNKTPLIIRWNSDARSQTLNGDVLSKLTDVLPSWKAKQMIWPSIKEVNVSSVVADQEVKASCINWLKKFFADEYLPLDIETHLISMKNWGLIREESEQKRLCDVFVVRFTKGTHTVHIQESPYNVVISFADDTGLKKERIDHEQFALDTAKLILKGQMYPDPNSDIHTFEIVRGGIKISRIVWLTKSVGTTDRNGKKTADLRRAGENGAVGIEAETDGRFVRFEIIKCPGAVKAAYFDPYEERFKSYKE